MADALEESRYARFALRCSNFADSVGFAAAPTEVTDKGSSWLYAWSLAIPATSKHKDAAKAFITWATTPTRTT